MSKSTDIKVLIVEDDPMVGQIIDKFLKRISGFHVVGVEKSFDAAKNFIETNVVDLLLLDIYLPGGHGTDLLHWLRSQKRLTDAIMITADTKTETIKRAMSYGAVDYLVKPFRFERFEEALIRYKSTRHTLHEHMQIDQDTIDQLYKKGSGMNYGNYKNQTAETIINFLKDHKEVSFTAKEVADELGISRITSRRYLEEMEQNNEVALELSYGGVGRPKNYYRYVGAGELK